MKKYSLLAVLFVFFALGILWGCVPSEEVDQSPLAIVGEAGKATATCTDSDKGKNYGVQGVTLGIKDFCKDGKTLVEFYCDKGQKKEFNYKCSAGCKNGACLPVPVCGNGKAETGETCSSCGKDVQCSKGKVCQKDVCVKPLPTCLKNEALCGKTCVNLNKEAKNCGSCGKICKSGEVCSLGKCVVEQKCGNKKKDAGETCLSCPGDVQCTTGENCNVKGLCEKKVILPACLKTESLCNNLCVDVTSDTKNCGSCGKACGKGELCSLGKCVVEQKCGNGRVDLGETCSSCANDVKCSPGEKCNPKGICEKSIASICGNGIVEPGETCDVCPDVKCPQGQVCQKGSCVREVVPMPVCPKDRCGNQCVDVKKDAKNCGSCGTVCSGGMACSNGKCIAEQKCGNKKNDVGETCLNCPGDVQCLAEESCQKETQICVKETVVPGSQCLTNQGFCGGQCVFLQFNTKNCGACGIICDAAKMCYKGQCITSTCGNGKVEPNKNDFYLHEECDDGNRRNSDGCSSACDLEKPPVCGDYICEKPEDDERFLNWCPRDC